MTKYSLDILLSQFETSLLFHVWFFFFFLLYYSGFCHTMSGSNCCFLTCIPISQEVGKVVWYWISLRIFHSLLFSPQEGCKPRFDVHAHICEISLFLNICKEANLKNTLCGLEQKNMSIGQNLPMDSWFVTSERAIASQSECKSFLCLCNIKSVC